MPLKESLYSRLGLDGLINTIIPLVGPSNPRLIKQITKLGLPISRGSYSIQSNNISVNEEQYQAITNRGWVKNISTTLNKEINNRHYSQMQKQVEKSSIDIRKGE